MATTNELARGDVLPARLGGEDLVAWRTTGGEPRVAGAWCPHLGAHLGHSGSVEGERLRCGFHGFCFDAEGRCESSGYAGRAPAKAQLRMRPVRETGGMVLTWLDPARPAEPGEPDFAIPDLTLDGWTRPSWRDSTFASHPMETTENSVDIGHLAWLHGYDDVAELEPATVEGPTLRARYQMTRGRRSTGLPLPTMTTEFDVTVHGLGVSIVDLTVVTLGVRQRLYVLPTPLGDGLVRLRLGVTTRLDPLESMPTALRRVPPQLLARAIREFTLIGLYFDVRQDRRVWTTKRHVPHPMLAEGDGPIGLYRKWAGQFLGPAAPESGAEASEDSASAIG